MALSDNLIWLAKKLYPNGRAFRMPEPTATGDVYVTEDNADNYVTEDEADNYVSEDYQQYGGILYRLHQALNLSLANIWRATYGLLNDILPDNPYFTIEDAHDWYRRLGIYDSGNVPFEDMKLAIAQKMSWPLVPLDKQHWLFIQDQLQAAGFDVHVYENRFLDPDGNYVTYSPQQIIGRLPVPTIHSPATKHGAARHGVKKSTLVAPVAHAPTTLHSTSTFHKSISLPSVHSPFVRHGMIRHNGAYTEKIVNYIEAYKDAPFIVTNYRSTFFIGGDTILKAATVPDSRRNEFRQLILKLKPAQMCGYMYINYV